MTSTSNDADSDPPAFRLPDAAAAGTPRLIEAVSIEAVSDALSAAPAQLFAAPGAPLPPGGGAFPGPAGPPTGGGAFPGQAGAVLFLKDLTWAELTYFHVISTAPLGILGSPCFQPPREGRYLKVEGFYYFPIRWQWFMMPEGSEVTVYKDSAGGMSWRTEKSAGSQPAWVSTSEYPPKCGWPWFGQNE